MSLIFHRSIRDAAWTSSLALPAAGNTATQAAFTISGGLIADEVAGEIAWPDLAALADAKSVTIRVQDSADGSTFDRSIFLMTLTGAGGIGTAAGTRRFGLPSNCREHIRLSLEVDTDAGDLTASEITASLLF